MWKLVLVVGLLGGGTGGVLAQSGGAAAFDWGSLIGGAIGSSPAAVVLFFQLLHEQKNNKELRVELAALHKQMVDMGERAYPILADSARTLDKVQSGLEATIERQLPRRGDSTDLLVRRLEAALSELESFQRRGDGP